MTQLYAMLQRNLLYTGVTRRQAACGSGWAEEGCRYRRAQRLKADGVGPNC